MRPLFLLPLAASCAPPPPIDVLANQDPAIEILYPESGQEVVLADDCSLTEPIVVNVLGLELVPPNPDDIVEGQGHWHGGLDLGVPGYCASSATFCDDYAADGLRAGLLTLFVQLQNNGHEPLETGDGDDQVELTLVDPDGIVCP